MGLMLEQVGLIPDTDYPNSHDWPIVIGGEGMVRDLGGVGCPASPRPPCTRDPSSALHQLFFCSPVRNGIAAGRESSVVIGSVQGMQEQGPASLGRE